MELVRAQHVRAGPAAQMEWWDKSGRGPQELLHRGGDPAEGPRRPGGRPK